MSVLTSVLKMSTSTSDHEMSECSNSPQSYSTLESPHSSPSQQVPQLTTTLTGLSCADKNLYNIVNNANKNPFLQIVEQPQNHFRFRYVSEMVGTHGCLLGKSNANNNKIKTHPTVELVNYSGRALIRCTLAQHNSVQDHPHKLLEEEQDRDVSSIVPENGSYKVGFPGMGIIHTAKKDVSNLLYKKFSEQLKEKNFNPKELRAQCENLAKTMNLNIVRLKFSAHDIETGKEICDPVFSDPIHNMKSAATNDLKICRISMYCGRPRGGEDVFILVEKVNKKNIMIRFFELDENGERIWSETGTFLQSDVHHQYAIVFRTPQYKNPHTSVDVKVYIELVRPSDGRTSEPKVFTYKAEDVYKQIKKRKNNSSYSSLDSSSGASMTDLPVTVLFNNGPNDIKEETQTPVFNIQLPLQPAPSPTECGLGNALGTVLTQEVQTASPMWFQPTTPASSLPNLQLDSTELNIMTRDVPMENTFITQADFAQYIDSFSSSLGDINHEMSGMDFIRTTLHADSGRVKVEPSTSSPKSSGSGSQYEPPDKSIGSPDYPAFYKPDDAAEVKKLVKELCDMLRNKKYKNQEVRDKLERLFEIRLSNGDTFLHMTLCSNQPSFNVIVKLIHVAKMTHLLNYGNNKQQTILHLAVLNGTPENVAVLIARGCNPMLKDSDEDNVIHYAVRYNSSFLEPLLDAIKKNDVPCDLNASNSEKQSALHLCALYACGAGAAALVSRGASYNVRDALGRTPLHLAAYDGQRDVARALLHAVRPSDVDALDGSGNTALQIVCGRPMDKNTVEMVTMLLEKKADPLKHEDHNESAWRLSRDKPQVREIMKEYVPTEKILEDDVKSEPEDDYESAEEDMEIEESVERRGLAELPLYARAVAARVEAAGAWRELARRLRAAALLSWLRNQPSPAYTLLHHVKECRDDITSKSLALILEDMGLVDAANIIRSHID